MKPLLTATAIIEGTTGVALVLLPSWTVALLLGSPLEQPVAVLVARVGGAGLLSLGIACWLARGDAQSRAPAGLVAAMTLYNIAAVALLAHAGIGLGLNGVGLWPAVALHVAMAVWCIARLWVKRA